MRTGISLDMVTEHGRDLRQQATAARRARRVRRASRAGPAGHPGRRTGGPASDG